jgi:hypothetical protein
MILGPPAPDSGFPPIDWAHNSGGLNLDFA